MGKRKNEKWFVALVVLTLFLVSGILLREAFAEPQSGEYDERGLTLTDRQLQIEHAVLTVIMDGVPKYKIEPYLGNELAKNRTMRLDLVLAIDEASTRHGVPPMLLVAMAYREGSFRMAGRGALDELSTFQMVRYVARKIKKDLEPECDLSTYRGAALCAAAWLAHHASEKRCGTMQGSFMIYATGKRCVPSTAHQVWVLRDRFGLARALELITDYALSADSLSFNSRSANSGN